jgi:hypothetical protein
MRKELTFCLSIFLSMGALIAPTAFAAEKSYFEASETFDPFGYYGTPVGYYLSPGTVKCPGDDPTGNPEQPCPLGSRTHTRDVLVVVRVDSSDPRMAGWMTVELNGNFDADGAGPVWGTFNAALDSGGTWEGTWQGRRVFDPEAEEEKWTAELHVSAKGYGGIVDGMIQMSEDHIKSPTAVPIAWLGEIQGRIVDPK